MAITFNPHISMTINLTKQQYWHLMRAIYIADWVANAICEEDMKEDNDIKNIRDYIFSFAKEMGYEDYVEYDEKCVEYYPTWDMDDEPSIRGLIERYDDHEFWEELIERLGGQDFFKKYSQPEILAMSDDDRFIKHMECEEAWAEEFENYSIERLGIEKK